jgi:hypothetical protein
MSESILTLVPIGPELAGDARTNRPPCYDLQARNLRAIAHIFGADEEGFVMAAVLFTRVGADSVGVARAPAGIVIAFGSRAPTIFASSSAKGSFGAHSCVRASGRSSSARKDKR